MKILHLLISILILTSSLFYSCKTEKRKIIKDGNISLELEKYKDSENNFSIEYPISWIRIKGNEDVIFIVKMANDSLNNSFKNTIHITKIVDKKDALPNLTDIAKENINDMSNSFVNFQVIKSKNLEINNNSAIKVKCTFDAHKTSITSLLYFIKTADRIYLVGLSSLTSKFNKYEKAYEYIAKTFNNAN